MLQLAKSHLHAFGLLADIDGVGRVGARLARLFDKRFSTGTGLFEGKHAARLAAGKADDQHAEQNEKTRRPVRPEQAESDFCILGVGPQRLIGEV